MGSSLVVSSLTKLVKQGPTLVFRKLEWNGVQSHIMRWLKVVVGQFAVCLWPLQITGDIVRVMPFPGQTVAGQRVLMFPGVGQEKCPCRRRCASLRVLLSVTFSLPGQLLVFSESSATSPNCILQLLYTFSIVYFSYCILSQLYTSVTVYSSNCIL